MPTSTQPVIFDTNRAWTAKLPALMRLFPDAKVICCVRDVAWVMDSLERQFRNNAFEHTRLFNNPAERATVYTRVEALAHANRLVGFPWHALREACYSEFAERMLVLEYDLLASRPAEVFKLIYEFLGEEPFAHDFAKVEYDAPEFDAQLGMDGLHRVRAQVKPQPAQDHPAARPVPALRPAVVLARPEGLQGLPHRRAGERREAARDHAGAGAGDRPAGRPVLKLTRWNNDRNDTMASGPQGYQNVKNIGTITYRPLQWRRRLLGLGIQWRHSPSIRWPTSFSTAATLPPKQLDGGGLSLREALALANGDGIVFTFGADWRRSRSASTTVT